MRSLARILVSIVAAAGVLPAAPADIGLALVHGDGRLQPLATLAGDEWTPLAPAEAAGAWSLWLFDDPAVKAQPFAPRAPRTVTASAGRDACLALAGLDPAVLTPNAAAARPPVGIALRGSEARPDVPVLVPPDSGLGTQLAARAAPAFHRAEDETLTLEAEELPAEFPRFAARRERPIVWTLIARQGVAQGAVKTYYLEGRKDYDGLRGRTDIGRIRTTGHVFVQMDGERATIDAEVDLSDVEGHQSMFRTPLAVIPWPARSAWLFAARGPGGGQLEIVELRPGATKPRSVWEGPDGCERGSR